MTGKTELVRFRLSQGRTVAEWLESNKKLDAWLQRQPGFRLRSLSETSKGEWIDLLCWESGEAAELAGERFEVEMAGQCEPMIDIASIQCEQGQSHVLLQQ
ncbi:MAG: hypothetical protein PHH36_06800 [Sideroxydans sp.]|nr:hypothetical protein [Sideroxydans sp.]